MILTESRKSLARLGRVISSECSLMIQVMRLDYEYPLDWKRVNQKS